MARFTETVRLVTFLALMLTTVSSFPASEEVETDIDTSSGLILGAAGDDVENAPSDKSAATGVVDSNCDCDDVEALCHKYVRQLLDTQVIKGKDDFLKEFRIKKICGSDGKFYSSGCEFQCARLNTEGLHRVNRMSCRKSSKGRVMKEKETSRKQSKYPKVKSHQGEAKSARLERIEKEPASPMVCICPRNYYPVCASNGITYGNKCAFDCAKENIDQTLTVVKLGDPCNVDDKTVL